MTLKNIYEIIEATGISFLFLIMVFVPMEKVFPAKKIKNSLDRNGY